MQPKKDETELKLLEIAKDLLKEKLGSDFIATDVDGYNAFRFTSNKDLLLSEIWKSKIVTYLKNTESLQENLKHLFLEQSKSYLVTSAAQRTFINNAFTLPRGNDELIVFFSEKTPPLVNSRYKHRLVWCELEDTVSNPSGNSSFLSEFRTQNEIKEAQNAESMLGELQEQLRKNKEKIKQLKEIIQEKDKRIQEEQREYRELTERKDREYRELTERKDREYQELREQKDREYQELLKKFFDSVLGKEESKKPSEEIRRAQTGTKKPESKK
jgi:uncharacterized protein (DUF342 family)